MHIILILNLGDHEGLSLFIHGCLLKRTLLIVLPVILMWILVRAFLSPVPAYCLPRPVWDTLVLPRNCWPDVNALAPNSGKLSIGFVYFVLFLFLLILLLLLVLLLKLFIFNL